MEEKASEENGGLNKCVQGLPWNWDASEFKNYLVKQDIVFCEARKRKGSTAGFVDFDSREHAESATEKLEATEHKGKKRRVLDALPRRINQGGSKQNEDSDGDLKQQNAGGEPKDVSEIVTPLASKSYDEQLQVKRESAVVVLKKFVRHTRKCCSSGDSLPDWLSNAKDKGGLACEFEGIIPSPLVEGYRNKCEFSAGFSSGGEKVVGFQMGEFRKGITAIESARNCRNVSDIAKFYASAMEEFVRNSAFGVWDKEKNSGFWRMVTVREGRHPRNSNEDFPPVAEVMIIVQVSPAGIPDDEKKQEYERMARELSARASSASPSVPLTSLFVQEHIGVSNAASEDALLVPLSISSEESPIQHIYDYIGDLKFRISPTAFFQVNSFGAEKLYSLAGEWAGLGPNTLLFDVCCGTGTIGLTLARKVGMVVGIELNAQAVADAWTNAKLNNITNCKFVCAKAEDVIRGLLNEYEVLPEGSSSFPSPEEGGDEKKRYSNIVVIVDPPRSGLHPSVVKALRMHSRLKRLVYISCNPDTMVANSIELCAPLSSDGDEGGGKEKKRGWNVKGMTSMGYARQRVKNMPASEPFKPVKALAVDLFPHTHHCEMVLLLQR